MIERHGDILGHSFSFGQCHWVVGFAQSHKWVEICFLCLLQLAQPEKYWQIGINSHNFQHNNLYTSVMLLYLHQCCSRVCFASSAQDKEWEQTCNLDLGAGTSLSSPLFSACPLSLSAQLGQTTPNKHFDTIFCHRMFYLHHVLFCKFLN